MFGAEVERLWASVGNAVVCVVDTVRRMSTGYPRPPRRDGRVSRWANRRKLAPCRHYIRMAREGEGQRGPVPVQLRFHSGHTSEDTLLSRLWRSASLSRCPIHAKGGCAFARHGTYTRTHPPGTRIARWYCPQGHCTFGLLPDHLAARFPGTLTDIETVVAGVERAPSVEAAANALRPDDVTLATALRWVRRRVRLVHTVLTVVVSLLPDLCLGCSPTVESLRMRFGCEQVLIALRALTSVHLHALAPPLGLRPPGSAGGGRKSFPQQHKGPDPPALGG